MDYAASYNQRDFTGIDVIVANSTANYLKVAAALKAHKYEHVEFYHQNDKSGVEFIKNVVKEAEVKEFEYLKYKKSESGQDVNDLHKNGVDIESRKIKNQAQEVEKESFVENLLEKLEHANDLIEIAQKAKAINRDDFVGSLSKIAKDDAKAALEIMNDIHFTNIKDGINFVKAIGKAAIEVIKNGD